MTICSIFKKYILVTLGTDYIQHLKEFGPQRLVEFSPVLHSFMDYFDLAAPLICARIVDVLDAINNKGVSSYLPIEISKKTDKILF